MSMSSPDAASRILLMNASTQIRAKIRGVVTDSTQGITYDLVARLGTSNLLNILAACTDRDVAEVAKGYENKGHGQLKSEAADAVEEMLKGPWARFESIRREKVLLEDVVQKGALQATELSKATIDAVRRRVGLS